MALARRPYDVKDTSISTICKMPQVPRSTLFRYVQVKRKTPAGDVNG
ncbi:MAG: hypothetical protein AB7P40_30820 [Chloroflexota bacterium]